MWLQDEDGKGIKTTSGVEEIGKYLLWWLIYLGMENFFSEMCMDCVELLRALNITPAPDE